jgi:serine/threonine-protein kinase
MVMRAGHIKVLDFGLALAMPDPRLTATGTIVGSMHYIPPEQVSGESYDSRSDLYAVGVTLYEMITGHLPFAGDSYAQVVAAQLQHEPKAPVAVNSAIPATLSSVVLKALAKDKSDRWQTAEQFLHALDKTEIHELSHVSVSTLSSRPSTGRLAMQPDQLGEITRKLATYVGPIANLLVKRASSSSHNLQELCDRVAVEIESPEARERFLKSVRAQLRSSGQL